MRFFRSTRKRNTFPSQFPCLCLCIFLHHLTLFVYAMAASASPTSRYNYQVFLNHRGEVKKTFASHLYRRLIRDGFRVFLDQSEMQAGDDITSQITEAIATASVHIAIFSPGYAESKWCLKELVLMLGSKGTTIPVFYRVVPSTLRRTRDKSEVYGKALCNLEKKKRYEPDIPIWRGALSSVSEISGLELKECNDDEGELVDRVVQRVKEIIIGEIPPLYVAAYPTGLDKKLEDFQKTVLLPQQQHSTRTKIFGIVGPCGVGKTTLATEFFNRNRSGYARSCVLFDVRDKPLSSLQNKLLRDLTSLTLNIDNIYDGIGKLSHHLLGCHVLIILDDVDNNEQLNALFSPVKGVLHPDSLILVTSRNKEALTRSGIEEASIYKLEGLDEEHSRQLFCLHAFNQSDPKEGFEDVVQKFLKISDGLPLSLRELGAQLFKEPLPKLIKEPLKRWEAHLRKQSGSGLPSVIERRLKVTYEGLAKEEKEIFLDIACFFIEEDRDMAIGIWEVSDWNGKLNLENLENKFLLEIDSENCIKMHHHIRNLGRGLADKEELRTFHRRIWNPNEKLSYNVFHQPTVRGMYRVHEKPDELHESHRGVLDMSHLQLLRAEGNCLASISNLLKDSDLLWLCWDKCPYTSTSLPPWIPTRNLNVPQVVGCKLKLWHGESEPPLMLELNENIETKDTIKLLGKDFSPPLVAALETTNSNDVVTRYQMRELSQFSNGCHIPSEI